MTQFNGLSAILLNCSLVHDPAESHTRRLLARVAGIIQTEGVTPIWLGVKSRATAT